MHKASLILWVCAIGTFVLACLATVFPLVPGWMALIGGASVTPAWFANPLLFVAWFLLATRHPRAALACTVCAGAIAFTVFTLRSYTPLNFVYAPTLNITEYGAGFYLWFISILLTLVASTVRVLARYVPALDSRRFAIGLALAVPVVGLVAFFLYQNTTTVQQFGRSNQAATVVADNNASTFYGSTDGWSVVRLDSFSTVSEGDWAVGSFADKNRKTTFSAQKGKYIWEDERFGNEGLPIQSVLPNRLDVHDFRVTVTGQRMAGVENCGYGLLLHYFDAFIIRDTGEWFFVTDVHKSPHVVLKGTSNAIRPNQPNTLRAIGEGYGAYSLFVNGERVGMRNPDGIDDGIVSLAVENTGTGICKIAFDDFELRVPSLTQVNNPTPSSTTTAAAMARLKSSSNWSPVLSDSFDGVGIEWKIPYSNIVETEADRTIADGKYTWRVKAARPSVNVLSLVLPPRKEATNYVASVEVKHVSGSEHTGYGLSLMYYLGNSYLFEIRDDSSYSFTITETDVPTIDLVSGKSSAIRPGEVNRLSVIYQKDIFELFINDKFVAQAQDSTYGGMPYVGLPAAPVVNLSGSGLEDVFEFDNFIVRAP